MTGGNRQGGYDDGYDKSPEELAQDEQSHDDLEALEQGLKHLRLASGYLEAGGWCLPNVIEDIAAIKKAIELFKEREP